MRTHSSDRKGQTQSSIQLPFIQIQYHHPTLIPHRESKAPFKHERPVNYPPGINGYKHPGIKIPGPTPKLRRQGNLEGGKMKERSTHRLLVSMACTPFSCLSIHLVHYSSILFSILRHARIASHLFSSHLISYHCIAFHFYFHFHSIQSNPRSIPPLLSLARRYSA